MEWDADCCGFLTNIQGCICWCC